MSKQDFWMRFFFNSNFQRKRLQSSFNFPDRQALKYTLSTISHLKKKKRITIDNKEPSQKPHNIFLQDMYSITDRIKTNK